MSRVTSETQLFPETSGAEFSDCRTWRYRLWRIWDHTKPYANFLMLNPSIADANVLDPTVTRCVAYARRWGYGGLHVTNLFALVSTDPDGLYRAADPVGPDNDVAILETARGAGVIVCAWGNHGGFGQRQDAAVKMLRAAGVQLAFLRMNGTGEPAHPLYLPGDLVPLDWTVEPRHG